MNIKQDNYEIIKQIGKGSYSQIYQAFDKKNKRYCALKVIKKELINKSKEKDYLIKLIKNEVKIMNLCKSKNIVEFYDYFETINSFVISMELCNFDLEQYIQKKKENSVLLDLSFIQRFFKDLNNAILTLCKYHIIHRDLKPSNIFIKIENGNLIPKLGDFGISTIDLIVDKNFFYGTPTFMAPELLLNISNNKAINELYIYNSNKCDLYMLLGKMIK